MRGEAGARGEGHRPGGTDQHKCPSPSFLTQDCQSDALISIPFTFERTVQAHSKPATLKAVSTFQKHTQAAGYVSSGWGRGEGAVPCCAQ